MSDPTTIICPNCRTEIKLTESLAAPLIESTRRQFEEELRQKDSEIEKRVQESLMAIRAQPCLSPRYCASLCSISPLPGRYRPVSILRLK